MQLLCPFRATFGLARRSKLVILFDDFVGLRKQRRRQREVEHPCGFQVYDQLERPMEHSSRAGEKSPKAPSRIDSPRCLPSGRTCWPEA
jgi:hypothetical protein